MVASLWQQQRASLQSRAPAPTVSAVTALQASSGQGAGRGRPAATRAPASRGAGRRLAGELGGGGQGAGRGRPAARVPTAAPWNLQGARSCVKKLDLRG